MVLTSLLTLFIVVSNVSISPSFSALFTSFSDFFKLTFDFFFPFDFWLVFGYFVFRSCVLPYRALGPSF